MVENKAQTIDSTLKIGLKNKVMHLFEQRPSETALASLDLHKRTRPECCSWIAGAAVLLSFLLLDEFRNRFSSSPVKMKMESVCSRSVTGAIR